MSSLYLQPVKGLSNNACSPVSSNTSLNCFFSSLHTLHKWWRWKQDAELVYAYFNRPALALGDILIHQLAHESQLYTIIAVALGVIRCLWEAENVRRILLRDFYELKWQVLHPTIIPFHPKLLEPGLKAALLAVALKLYQLFTLVFRVLHHSFCLSMHLIDLYQHFSNQQQQERAKRRCVSNFFFLHQERNLILAALTGPTELPFFQKMGVQVAYIEKLHTTSQILTQTCKEMTPLTP